MTRTRALYWGFLLLGCPLVACSDSGGPAGALTLSLVSGNGQEAQVGTQLTDPLVVTAEDAAGNRLPGQVVNFVVTSGGGSVFAGASVTNAEGVAQELWTLGLSAAQLQRVEVRAVDPSTGEPKVFGVFEATALPGPVASIAFPERLGNVQLVPEHTAVPDPDSVTAFDAYGNPVPGVPITFGIHDGSGSITGEHQTTDASGQARVGEWIIGSVGEPQTLYAEAEPLGSNLLAFYSVQAVDRLRLFLAA
jgi:hypothetical protein